MSAVEYVDIPVELLESQIEALNDPADWSGIRGGNGSGKTTVWAWWTLQRMIEFPKSNFVVIGASYQQLDQGFFNTLQDVLCKDLGLSPGNGYVYRHGSGGKPILRLWNGAKIHGWSAEQSMRTRSANVQTLVLEEPQTWGPSAEKAWVSANSRLRINPTVIAAHPDIVPKGRVSFNPTDVGPGHWLYEMIEKRWPGQGWVCRRFSSRDNAILLRDNPGYIRNLEVSMSPQRWSVELEGHYQTSGGDVYRNFDFERNCGDPTAIGLPPLGLHPHLRLLWAHDFNIGFQCSTISQLHIQQPVIGYADGRSTLKMPVPEAQKLVLYTLGEIALEEAGSDDVVKHFLANKVWADHARQYGITLYGDPSGGNRSQANVSITSWMAIIRGLEAEGITRANGKLTLRIPPSHPAVLDRINDVNAQFMTTGGTSGTGRNGVGAYIDPDNCPELLTDFRQVSLIPGKNEIDKKNAGPKRTHMSDAYGYMVHEIRKRDQMKMKSQNRMAR